MRKAFSLLAAIIIIFAAGCEKQSKKNIAETKLPDAFSCIIEAECGEVSMTANFTQTSFGNGKIKLLTPEIMKPLELTFTDEKCEVIYDSMSFKTESNRFPQAEIGCVLVQTLAYIETGVDIEKTSEKGTVSYSGSCEHGMFVLKQNAENGSLTEFAIENKNLHIKFKDFKTE